MIEHSLDNFREGCTFSQLLCWTERVYAKYNCKVFKQFSQVLNQFITLVDFKSFPSWTEDEELIQTHGDNFENPDPEQR